MTWHLEFSKDATSDVASLDGSSRQRVIARLDWLIENFERITLLPLSGQWKGFFKLRTGDIRIIYSVKAERQIIRVEYIDRRDKVYKRR